MKKRSIFLIGIIIMLIVPFTFPIVNAAPDTESRNSLRIHYYVQINGVNVSLPGAEIGICRVSDLEMDSRGIASYTLLPEYNELKKYRDGKDVTFDGLSVTESVELAGKLSEYDPDSEYISVTEQNGDAVFEIIPKGMYLVRELNAGGKSAEYELFDPYIISVPLYMFEIQPAEWINDVISEPKTEIKRKPESSEPIESSEPVESSKPSESSEPSEPYESSDVSVPSEISREGESDVTETRSAPKVGINTAAEISSTSKSYNYRRATSWNSSWGEKPADADDYYYLCWTIYTTFSDCTQPFDFKLTDILSETEKDGETVSEVVGYKLSGASTFTDVNTAYNQRPNRINYSDSSSTNYRYDYVLTRHKKSAFPMDTHFDIENKISATVTPLDRVDPETEEEDVETFINVPAKYKPPIGSYWSEKYGSGRLNYSLDDLRDGAIHYTDTNLYYSVYLYSQAYLWTLEDGASVTDTDKFGKKKVKFEITDDKFTFNGNNRQLTKDDYEIRSISFDYTFYDADFDETKLEFYSKSATYADDETLEIEAKFGDSDEFVKIGRYYFKTGQSEIENAYRDKVRSITSGGIVFEDDALCTGYRITTENVHYYSRINAYPYCRLKGSPYIIEKMGNLNKVYLTNTATTKLFSGETEMFSRTSSANAIIVGVQRQSYINKYCTSSTDNKVKKYGSSLKPVGKNR